MMREGVPGASDPPLTADAANTVEVPEVLDDDSVEENEVLVHQSTGSHGVGTGSTEVAVGVPEAPIATTAEDRPAIVEVVQEEEANEEDKEDEEDLKVNQTREAPVTLSSGEVATLLVDPPTSSDEATSEVTNGGNAEPPDAEDDETASDTVEIGAVDAEVSSSLMSPDQAPDARRSLSEGGPAPDSVAGVAEHPNDGDTTKEEMEPLSVVVSTLPALPATGDDGGNEEILKPKQLTPESQGVGGSGDVKTPPPMDTPPRQSSKGDEENAGENLPGSKTPRSQGENRESVDDPSFVNRGLALWENSRRQWSHRREMGGGQDSEGSHPMAIPLDVDEIIDIVFTSPKQIREEGGPRPFPQPVPLPQMIDILVDLWYECCELFELKDRPYHRIAL